MLAVGDRGWRAYSTQDGRELATLTQDDHEGIRGLMFPSRKHFIFWQATRASGVPEYSLRHCVVRPGAVDVMATIPLGGMLDDYTDQPFVVDESRALLKVLETNADGSQWRRRYVLVDTATSAVRDVAVNSPGEDLFRAYVNGPRDVLVVEAGPAREATALASRHLQLHDLTTGNLTEDRPGILASREGEPLFILDQDQQMREWQPWDHTEPGAVWGRAEVLYGPAFFPRGERVLHVVNDEVSIRMLADQSLVSRA